jgi:hypothetical protein
MSSIDGRRTAPDAVHLVRMQLYLHAYMPSCVTSAFQHGHPGASIFCVGASASALPRRNCSLEECPGARSQQRPRRSSCCERRLCYSSALSVLVIRPKLLRWASARTPRQEPCSGRFHPCAALLDLPVHVADTDSAFFHRRDCHRRLRSCHHYVKRRIHTRVRRQKPPTHQSPPTGVLLRQTHCLVRRPDWHISPSVNPQATSFDCPAIQISS